ncbi:BCL-6 corepressor-like protein 1 [Sardina pilchardus]|uniref:BCL-6 corepressor-like protein 1 n=1 Tax=Sardina pilchardus TaxID=27697 RepID=UPI002E11E130
MAVSPAPVEEAPQSIFAPESIPAAKATPAQVPIAASEPIPAPVHIPAPVPVSAPVPVFAPELIPVPVPIQAPVPISVSEPIPAPVAISAPMPIPAQVPISATEPIPAPVHIPASVPISAPVPVSAPVPIPPPVPLSAPVPIPAAKALPALADRYHLNRPRRRYADIFATSVLTVPVAPPNMLDLMAPMAIPDLIEDQDESGQCLKTTLSAQEVMAASPAPVEEALKSASSKDYIPSFKRYCRGWLTWILSKKEAHLPDDTNKSIFWDVSKQKWVDRNEPEKKTKAVPPPPMDPPLMPPWNTSSSTGCGGPSTLLPTNGAPVNMFRRTGEFICSVLVTAHDHWLSLIFQLTD